MSLYFDSTKGMFRVRLQKGKRRVQKWLPKGTTEETAREIHSRLLNDLHRMHAKTGDMPEWQEAIDVALGAVDGWPHVAYGRAAQRSRARRMAFPLAFDDFVFICRRSGGRCEVTGIPFSDERVGPKGFRPYRQSLDRIHSTGEYSMDNCRLVCAGVNFAMGTWGAEVLHRIAVGLVLNRFYPPWLDAQVGGLLEPSTFRENRKVP